MACVCQAPISCSVYSGVPFWTCQLAQVCRRSCHRKLVIPARFSASFHALVLICLIGSPRKVKTLVACFPPRRLRAG